MMEIREAILSQIHNSFVTKPLRHHLVMEVNTNYGFSVRDIEVEINDCVNDGLITIHNERCYTTAAGNEWLNKMYLYNYAASASVVYNQPVVKEKVRKPFRDSVMFWATIIGTIATVIGTIFLFL